MALHLHTHTHTHTKEYKKKKKRDIHTDALHRNSRISFQGSGMSSSENSQGVPVPPPLSIRLDCTGLCASWEREGTEKEREKERECALCVCVCVWACECVCVFGRVSVCVCVCHDRNSQQCGRFPGRHSSRFGCFWCTWVCLFHPLECVCVSLFLNIHPCLLACTLCG